MMSFKVLNYFHVSHYSKFNSKLATAQGHSDKQQTNGHKVEMSFLFKTNCVVHSGSFCSTGMYLSNDVKQSNEI